jgi:DNA-binding CsgD family transcriptional regulator
LVFSDDLWRDLAHSLKLSQRESEILQAVFDDHKESRIADNLGISSHTVHTHFERLYRKLGVSSRVTLVWRVFVEYLSLQDGRHVPGKSCSPRSVLRGHTGKSRRRAGRQTSDGQPTAW